MEPGKNKATSNQDVIAVWFDALNLLLNKAFAKRLRRRIAQAEADIRSSPLTAYSLGKAKPAAVEKSVKE